MQCRRLSLMTDPHADRKVLNLYSRARLDDRAINELLGLAKGIAADGIVNQKEAEFLQKWLVANTAVKDNPVIATLFKRINEMLEDNNLDDEEAQELLDTLHKFGGGDFELGEIQKATRLHFDDPPPSIDFHGRRFCFTGTFAYGSRSDCKRVVESLGGTVGSLTKATDYLVVGVYATDSWAHSSFGRKIEKAVEYREEGSGIAIIGEEHWIGYLPE